MKRFLISILLIIGIPLIWLVGIYIWTDPFRCIHDFDINDIDAVNREYLSTELFLRNYPTYHYNSFIFASSRGMSLNTYQWKQYLPEGAKPFLFQAWSETVTGIEMKMTYMDSQQIPIENALIMIDIPGSLVQERQSQSGAMYLRHYILTGDSRMKYNIVQFLNFIQKPSFIAEKIIQKIRGDHMVFFSDMISNDYYASNSHDYIEIPPQDSLNECSHMTKKSFVHKVEHLSDSNIVVSKPLITNRIENKLKQIHFLLEKNHSNYYIIISPAYCYTNASINPDDLDALYRIFGKERVYNYTGKNEMTDDYNNFLDPNHFGKRVGYMIIEDIYKKE